MQTTQESVTIHVRKGVKVNVVETEHNLADSRIPKDRDLVMSVPANLKVAVAEIGEGGKPNAKAALVLKCG